MSKSLGEIYPPVCKELSVKRLGQDCPDLRVSVVHVGSRETERDDLSPVVADQMQLEAVTPSHRSFPVGSQAFEDLVGITSEIMADWNHCRVHEADACTAPEGREVQEEHHLEEHAALQFHEAVVGYGMGEGCFHVLPDEEEVVMLEIAERAKLEHHQDGHHLTVGEGCLSVAAYLTIRGHKRPFVHLLIKFFAKFIHGTENFRNFVVGNHECILLFNLISN